MFRSTGPVSLEDQSVLFPQHTLEEVVLGVTHTFLSPLFHPYPLVSSFGCLASKALSWLPGWPAIQVQRGVHMQLGNSDVTKSWRSHRGAEVRIQEQTEDDKEGYYLVVVDTSHGGLNESFPHWKLVELFGNNQEV